MKLPPIKILGIDPGINFTGWAFGLYDLNIQKVTVHQVGTIEASSIAKREHKQDFKVYSNIVSLAVYEESFKNLMIQFTPNYVVSEDAFYNPRMPNAFLSLKLCIHTIQRVLYSQYQQILYRIPPTVIKQTIWGNGSANKKAVQEGIQLQDDLLFKDQKLLCLKI